MGECPCVGQRVGQIKFSLRLTIEVVTLIKLSFCKSLPCIPVWKGMAGAHGRIFFFISMMRIKNLGLDSDFLLRTLRFYPYIKSLNSTMMH